MYKILYPSQDTTLYERIPVKNTGVDSILQLVKQRELTAEVASELNPLEVDTWAGITNSQILLKFDYSALQQALQTVTSPVRYELKLYVASVANVPYTSILEVHPVAQDWRNGTGFYRDFNSKKDGASWYSASSAATWSVNGFPTGCTGSWVSTAGGAIWHTSSLLTSTASYGYESSYNLRFDITPIVNAHLSGSISNYGVVLKWDSSQEQDSETDGILNIYSRESYTVFPPKLVAYWRDASFAGTSSFTEVSPNSLYTVAVSNLKASYQDIETATLRLVVRDAYNTVTSYTASAYTNNLKRLPTSSYYRITDSVTDAVIVDYDTYNQISCDSNGNYFQLNFSNLQPERYYYLGVKSVFSSGETVQLPNIGFFKVTRI